MDQMESLAGKLEAAFRSRDIPAFTALLADDVRWGDDDHPRRCRSRADVEATFGRLMAEGVDAEIDEVEPGRDGILCRLRVNWPDPKDRRRGMAFYHAYLVREGRITEIKRLDDRRSALDAVGGL